MAKRKYSLRFDSVRDKWTLRNDDTEKVVRVFPTKEDATRAGALRKVLGKSGGMVTVFTRGGVFEEQRTFAPGSS